MKELKNEIWKSIYKLDSWIEKNGWEGYDPYDILGTKFFIFFQRTFKKIRPFTFTMEIIINRFPRLTRKIFRVKKQINPKAMALFARAYLQIYRKNNDKKYLEKALYCLNWLLENPSKGYSGFCWGYPFDWQSREFKSKGTPSGVVTSIAAHAFLDAYEILKEKKYLNVAESSCRFIINDLNIHHYDKDTICFSYTPKDNEFVHNANLFCSSLLIRTWSFTKDKKLKKVGLNAMKFTIHHQNKDGSWYYWAPTEKIPCHIDNYHTGFVLECLNIIKKSLADEFAYNIELEKGIKFYIKNLFLKDGTPKYKASSIDPIDIHSCAQGIITFSTLSDFDSKYLKTGKTIAKWSIKNMQDEEGYFYYRKYKKIYGIFRNYTDKMPYIRWGEAWMLRALSYII